MIKEESGINRGIYISANGLLSRQIQQDILAENIANINTPGHKKRNSIFTTFHEAAIYAISKGNQREIGVMPHGSQIDETPIDFSMGTLYETGFEYDFAILEEGFFIVETPSGDMYTRKGSFRVDNEGYLVTSEGHRVIGIENDYIFVEDHDDIEGQFAIANPPKEILIRFGEDLYQIPDQQMENIIENPQLKKGYLESSNVDLAEVMAETIETLRLFQLNQRVLLTQDELLRKSANEIGSLR